MRRELLLAEFLSTPWALMPERLAILQSVIGHWAAGNPRAMEDDDGGYREQKSVFEVRRQQAQALVANSSIAVLPCYGTIVQRAGMMTEWCGGTSTQQFTSALRDALADPNVAQIAIDFDTPGGSVYGVAEAGEEIRGAREIKPIIGIANSLSASAGYWLLSQCSEAYCTPGGEVGSIGVYTAHTNYAKAMEESGVEVTLIQAGKYKTEGNPYGPLDPDALANIQASVDRYYGMFTKAIAKGRSVSVEQVRNGMGQGRVLSAEDAVKASMIDGVDTFDAVIRRMQKSARNTPSPAASRRARAARELQILG
jgi:capsid assembly protease